MVRTSFAEDIGRRDSAQFNSPYAGKSRFGNVNEHEEHEVIDAVFAKWVPRKGSKSQARKGSKSQDSQAMEQGQETMAVTHPIVETARRENRRALLQTGDLTRSKGLAAKFKHYRLRDYFDNSGQRRYRNISMSFASRQSEEKDADGNKRSRENIQTRDQTAREARLAAEMIQRDRAAIHDKNLQVFRGLNEDEQELKGELMQRREDSLFIEIPNWQECLPESVTVQDLMCPLLSIEKERMERKQAERSNADISDDQKTARQGWLLTPNQLKEIIKVLMLSRQANGTEWSFGIDRSTYFRLLYDLGLIDEEICPASFVASCFDENARPLRMTKMESWVGDDVLATAPMCWLVSQWGFATAIDACLQRRYGTTPSVEFFDHLEDEVRRLNDQVKSAKLDTTQVITDDGDSPNAQKRATAKDLTELKRRRGELQEDHNAKAIKQFCVRERWIACMLVEPEVQEVVTKYKKLWSIFFVSYAGKHQEDNMSFEEFLQFARDWCLIPRLASTHVVLRAYRSAECLEKKKSLLSNALASKHGKSTESLHGKSSDPEPQQHAGDSLNTTIKPGPKGLAIETDMDDSSPQKKGKGAKLGHYTPASMTLRKGFGLACFTEAVLRTSFNYLAVNGNNIQQATSSKAKLLWLITYLRSVFLHAKESPMRSPNKQQSEGMKKCLDLLTQDLFAHLMVDDKTLADELAAAKAREAAAAKAARLRAAKGEEVSPRKGRHSPDAETLRQLKIIFDKCDTSGDGKIRKWELMKTCRKNHEIAQFLRLPNKYADDEFDSPSGLRTGRNAENRSQEFQAYFEEFFAEVQEGHQTGDATEDNELDFDEFKKFYKKIVEADEAEMEKLRALAPHTPSPEPMGPAAGRKEWHMRSLCTRGMGNAAPVAFETGHGSTPKPMFEDLNCWYGRVGNSCVTPPPLNEFSRTIDKRLEDMILDKQRRSD